MNKYTQMAFVINDIGAGHTKDADFGNFVRYAGKKLLGNTNQVIPKAEQLLGKAKQIVPRAGAFLGRHLGEGASARRAAEDLAVAANGQKGAIGKKLRAEADDALAKAMRMGNQQKYADLPEKLDKQLHQQIKRPRAQP